VTLYFTREKLAHQIFHKNLRPHFPNLWRLRLRGWDSSIYEKEYEKHKSVPITAFEVAPNLRVVELTKLAPSLLYLPWEQLTRFSADGGLSPRDCLEILYTASSLIECVFKSVADATDDKRSTPLHLPPDHVHPNLQSLTLSGDFSLCEDILSHLTLPALTALGVCIEDDEAEEVADFLSRSGVMLQRLDVDFGYGSFLTVLPFLAALTELSFSNMRTEGIMDFVCSLRDSDTFLPHLRALNITARNHTYSLEEEGMDYETLADALWERWAADGAQSSVSRLESFHMVWIPAPGLYDKDLMRDSCWGSEEDSLRGKLANFGTLDRLLDLVDEGMRLYLGTRHEQWVTHCPSNVKK
jgi:hypothetical protein